MLVARGIARRNLSLALYQCRQRRHDLLLPFFLLGALFATYPSTFWLPWLPWFCQVAVRRNPCSALCRCHQRRRSRTSPSSLEALTRGYSPYYWCCPLHSKLKLEHCLAPHSSWVSLILPPCSSWVRPALAVGCYPDSVSVLLWCLCFIYALLVGGAIKSNAEWCFHRFRHSPSRIPPPGWQYVEPG